jgi:hypothetical protein
MTVRPMYRYCIATMPWGASVSGGIVRRRGFRGSAQEGGVSPVTLSVLIRFSRKRRAYLRLFVLC